MLAAGLIGCAVSCWASLLLTTCVESALGVREGTPLLCITSNLAFCTLGFVLATVTSAATSVSMASMAFVMLSVASARFHAHFEPCDKYAGRTDELSMMTAIVVTLAVIVEYTFDYFDASNPDDADAYIVTVALAVCFVLAAVFWLTESFVEKSWIVMGVVLAVCITLEAVCEGHRAATATQGDRAALPIGMALTLLGPIWVLLLHIRVCLPLLSNLEFYADASGSVGRRFDAICGTFHCAAALVGTVALALATDPDPSVAPERYLWVGVANAAGFLPICLCLSFPCSAAWNRWLKLIFYAASVAWGVGLVVVAAWIVSVQ